MAEFRILRQDKGMTETLTKGERTRLKIVSAAIHLFAKKGFSQTSFQEIADRCKITQPAIFVHFKNKSALLNAVRKQVSASNHEFTDGRILVTDDALTALIKHCQSNIEWAIKNPQEAQIIFLTYYYAFFDPEFSAVFPSVIGLGTERILKYVLAGQRERKFHSKLDAETLSILIHEYLVGIFFRNLPGRKAKTWSPEEMHRLEIFLERILEIRS